MRHPIAFLAPLILAAVGCDAGRGAGMPGGADLAVALAPTLDLSPPSCPPPPLAGPEVKLAPAFAQDYKAYALGPVPGVPGPLGGMVAKLDDPNTLLVGGASESSTGAIYSIAVERDECGHIQKFVGTATKLGNAANVDANLVYGPGANGLILYTEWPNHMLSQIADGAMNPARRTDLRPLGTSGSGDSGPGGIGFVPPGHPAEGQLRVVTWSGGVWYHVAATLTGGLYTIGALTEAVRLPNNPGGFAYVPGGSPGFAKQSVIVSEWRVSDPTMDRVAVYDVDDEGDPVVATRREFMSKFPRPWGAYFDPMTGDYLFLTWNYSSGTTTDKVYLVQGFLPPPPIL